MSRVDPRQDIDWAACWAQLAAARADQLPLQPVAATEFWNRTAAAYPTSFEPGEDRLLEVLAPWLGPHATVIDVGAGTGRHVGALLPRVDWVTAVEPSEAMRAQLPAGPNLTVIASDWLDAEPAPAEVVICSHVMQAVSEVVPFVRHLEACATARVAIQLRDGPAHFPWDALFERITGTPRLREPGLADLYLVLRQMGISPDLSLHRRPARRSYPSPEAAVDDLRFRLGELFDEHQAAAFCAETMRPDGAGDVAYEPGEVAVGILHWEPARG